MKKRDNRIHRMVALAMMAAIVVLLANTPLGLIQTPIIKATTVHIPVILGAILLGPSAGCALGAVFGICSLISNTIAPTVTSFAFSPFYADGLVGAVKSLWISVGCRVLIGLVSGWLWIILKKVKVPDLAALPVVGFVGSMTNTVAVMGSIYFLLAEQYAAAREVAVTAVYGLIMATVTGAGVMEAVAALVLVTAIGKALLGPVRRLYDFVK
ncbi:MAG: ECF transporter S component [Clostridium sp.]|nr:ECF transporter S component [Clostridium sp.]